jgi:hypothetical protein
MSKGQIAAAIAKSEQQGWTEVVHGGGPGLVERSEISSGTLMKGRKKYGQSVRICTFYVVSTGHIPFHGYEKREWKCLRYTMCWKTCLGKLH